MFKKLQYIVLTFILATTILFGMKSPKVVFANEVTDYQLESGLIHVPTGQAITETTTVQTGETIAATYQLKFPDSQQIAENDTLTLSLPTELKLVTTLDFNIDVKNESGEIVGSAHTNANTGKVTVSFNDYFTRLPENKELFLQFNLTVNREVVTESGPVTVTIGSKVYKFLYQKDTGLIDEYEMKYGYQDDKDPSIIKWRIILNAYQDMIRGMTITDHFGDGQTLIPTSFRAVRYATQPTRIRDEKHILSLEPIDNFSSKAEFVKNENGGITGFTIPFGDNYNWSMYIEYSTRLPEGVTLGETVSNTLSWSATNFTTRSITRAVRLESGTGTASGEKSEIVTLKAKKELVGAALQKDQFQFALYDANDLNTALQTVTNDADGMITFEPIRYTTVGTYKYIIKEVVQTASTEYKYDTREIPVTVTITDENGRKISQVSYGDTNATFVNTYIETPTTIETTAVSGKKTWDDADNKDGVRPDKITVILSKLVADQVVEVSRKEVTEADYWHYEFTGLPKFENGQEIQYRISEEPVAAYETEVNGFDLINRHVPTEETPATPTTSVEDPQSGETPTTSTTDTPQPQKQPELPNTGVSSNLMFEMLGMVMIFALAAKFTMNKKVR